MLQRPPSPAVARARRWRAQRKAGIREARIRLHARRLAAALRKSNPEAGELEVLRKQLLALPQPSSYSDEQLRDIELWRRKQQFERRHPRPDYPAEVLEGFALDCIL
jgi:hypothetical protein